METGLQLLMRDGALKVIFRPRLSADQYTELLRLVEIAATKDELRRQLGRAASQGGHAVETDSVLDRGQ